MKTYQNDVCTGDFFLFETYPAQNLLSVSLILAVIFGNFLGIFLGNRNIS